MPHVYGDSTPFPYDIDCIDLLRHSVDCCVQLLSAEHAIALTRERSRHLAGVQAVEKAELSAIWDAVRGALNVGAITSERIGRSMARVLEAARATIDDELATLEREAAKDGSHERAIMERAIETCCRAMETLLLKHDVPETALGLRLTAGEETYSAEVTVQTPFGLDAVLTLGIPAGHEWSRPRRVADLSPGMEVRLPQEAGWLSKRVELLPVKLDRLFVSSVTLSEAQAVIQLRRSATSGEGYQLRVSLEEPPRVLLTALPESGVMEGEPPLPLDGEDRIQVLKLWSRISESTANLPARRQSLIAAHFDGVSLTTLETPASIALRLIELLTPIVQEIGRRSGAPGELVIRRDLGQGRREEVYITRAELEQKILVLPPELRVAFEPLGLVSPPPRAPMPSPPRLALPPRPEATPPRLEATPPRLEASLPSAEPPRALLEATE
jgi:hypothetical protein